MIRNRSSRAAGVRFARGNADRWHPSADHVAIIDPVLAQCLLDGTKTVESRLMRTRRAPFGRIRAGERILFKLCGGPCVAVARAARVETFSGLTPAGVRAIQRRVAPQVAASASYWHQRLGCRYGVLIWLAAVRPVRAAWALPRQFGSGWIVGGISEPPPWRGWRGR